MAGATVSSAAVPVVVRSLPSAFGAGAVIGVIGLGEAEFRLPLLIGVFGFVALAAVVIPLLVTLLLASSVKVWRYQ